MPRYFFNFGEKSLASPDLVGRDLPNDEAAKRAARKLAADFGFDHAIEGRSPSYLWIEVTDEAQRPVARFPIVAALREPNRTT